MATLPSEEEVLQLAEKLKEKFLEEHSDDPEVDSRDVTRIRDSLPYVCKFVRHNRGNVTNAYNHMVECQHWRKSFGVNDIKISEIDESLWKMGMAYNHGYDKQGNHIVVLNIQMHRRNSKKAPMLHKWIVFCYETHQRLYPDKKMCMIFNMNDAGLANMDMDLMRFIVNCFKIYFPDLLGSLLIFNMPWILQAAWKIVQSWLSEGAIAKVKFVTKETVLDYVDSDQLLERFGGTDPWQYDYQAEKRRLVEEAEKVWKGKNLVEEEEDSEVEELSLDHQDSLVNGDMSDPLLVDVSTSGSGQSTEHPQLQLLGAEEVDGDGEKKQVRFSSNLPPTHQSRYGDLAEEDKPSASPENRALMHGSTSNMRRRQVHKLMSQQQGAGKEGWSRRASNISSDGDTSSGPDSLQPRRHSEPQMYSAIGYLRISPSQELLFSGDSNSDIICTLTLTNISKNTVAYKIKTTAPLRYKVRPNLALIDPKSVAKIHVLLVLGSENTSISQDKFLVQSYNFDPTETMPTQSHLSSFWKSLTDGVIQEHRLKCRWLNHAAAKPSPTTLPRNAKETTARELAALPPRGTPQAADKPTRELQVTRENMRSLETKLDQVLTTNAELSTRVKRLLQLNYVILLLLVFLLMITFFF